MERTTTKKTEFDSRLLCPPADASTRLRPYCATKFQRKLARSYPLPVMTAGLAQVPNASGERAEERKGEGEQTEKGGRTDVRRKPQCQNRGTKPAGSAELTTSNQKLPGCEL